MSKIKTGAELNPTAEVRADAGKIIVSVGDGFYEVYVDKSMQQPALNNYQTNEYHAEPGEHRVGVYSAGRFVVDRMITVPAEETEQPIGEPDTAIITVGVNALRKLEKGLLEMSDLLSGILAEKK